MWWCRFRAVLLTCLSFFLLGAGLLLYGYSVERRLLEETHWVLKAGNWKGRPLRLAVIADLHARPGDGDYLDSIVRRTLEARPDAVLLLGDYINEPVSGESMDLESLGRHLYPLIQVPCFAVFGNHDVSYGVAPLRAMLRSMGAVVLDGGTPRTLEIGGDTLYLFGFTCYCRYCGPGKYTPPPPGATCIQLIHAPIGVRRAPRGTTVTLAAHTHGGQVCLPGGIPIIRQKPLEFWKRMQGEVREGEHLVYITRGLGTSKLPLRLFCRPELLFVELRGGK